LGGNAEWSLVVGVGLSVEAEGGVEAVEIAAVNSVADTEVNAVADTEVNAEGDTEVNVVVVAAWTLYRLHDLKILEAVGASLYVELVAVVWSVVPANLVVETEKNCVEESARLSPTSKV
jgi:hypothetical protein